MPMPLDQINPTVAWIHGEPDGRTIFNVAILSEGYVPSRMDSFNFCASRLGWTIVNHPIFSEYADRIGVVRINCATIGDGRTLRFQQPVPAGYTTPFDMRLDSTIPRAVGGSVHAVWPVIAMVQPRLPHIDVAVVILDNSADAATGPGGVVWMTDASTGDSTVVHEIGHSFFGLADEYEIRTGLQNEPVHSYSGREPVQPNITIARSRARIPWRELIPDANAVPSLPALPWTVPNTGGRCQRNKARKAGVPETAIGIYEGAFYNSCNVFRPAFSCIMRDGNQLFCAVCARVANRRMASLQIDGRPQVTVPDRRWTHVVDTPPDLSVGAKTHIAFCYNAVTGDYQIAAIDPLARGEPPRSLGAGILPAGFTSLISIEETRYIFASSFVTDRRALYRLVPGADSFNMTPDLEYDIQGGAVPGYSHVAGFYWDGRPMLLHYGRITGELELQRIVLSTIGAPAETIASTRSGLLQPWVPQLSGIAVANIDGHPYLIGLDASRGKLHVARMFTPGITPASRMLEDTWTSPDGFVPGFQTHISMLRRRGRDHICLYSSLGGDLRMYKPRAGGKGLDYEFGTTATRGAIAAYDVGMPALGMISRPPAGPGVPRDYLWLYNGALNRFHVVGLR